MKAFAELAVLFFFVLAVVSVCAQVIKPDRPGRWLEDTTVTMIDIVVITVTSWMLWIAD
jgi:hypothetical protein